MQEFAVRSAYRKLKFLNDEIDDRKSIFVNYEKDFMRVVKIARGNIRVNQDYEKLRKNLEDAAEVNARKHAESALEDAEAESAIADVPQKKLYRKIVINKV